jgi:hypothetical protein
VGQQLDVTNFFWLLRIAPFWWESFRLPWGCFDCLPFGWHFSPIIAQLTLQESPFSTLVSSGALFRTVPIYFWTPG